MTETAGTGAGPEVPVNDGTQGGQCQCGPCIQRAQKRHVRAWRWTARLDLAGPPAPVLRWLAILLIGIVYVAVGAPKQLSDWLWAAILGGLLIFPDIAGFAIGGFRLDLKQAQDGIAKLQQDVNAQARANAKASVGPIIFAQDLRDGIAAYKEVLAAGQPQEPQDLLPWTAATPQKYRD